MFVFVYYEKGKVLCRICIQERCHNIFLADGWAGGQAGRARLATRNAFYEYTTSQEMQAISEIKHTVVSTKDNTQNRMHASVYV